MTTPGGELLGEARIEVDMDTDPATRALRQFSRDANGRLRDIRGRFVAEGNTVQRSLRQLGNSIGVVTGLLIPLSTAVVPIASTLSVGLAAIAAQAGAAGAAVAAFGAAVAPQITALSEAAEAQGKYTEAVDRYGARSEQAIEAQEAIRTGLENLTPATRQAAGAFLVLREQFEDWSDELSEFTMVPVTRAIQLTTELLPKLTPLVEESSLQLTRLVTVAGGAVASPGFDALAERFSDFASDSLKRATDGIIHFERVLSSGRAPGPLRDFLEFAREQGPAVRETLGNIAAAAGNLFEAATQAGPGMLALVNALAGLVASVPSGFITLLLQAALALKAVSLAGRGIAAVSGLIAGLTARVVALQAASVAAGGGVAGLRAAFLSLGTAAKASVIVAGLAAVALVLTQLSEIGKQAPPDVDKMTVAIGNLGRSGKVSGEALRSYGDDLSGLAESLNTLTSPSNVERIQQFVVSLIGLDSTPVADAKKDVDAFDKSLASLVKGGNADLANAAFARAVEATAAAGHSTANLKDQLDDYKSAVADAAFEQQLLADSMGLFGQQALTTGAKLDAQKASADGLRQAIQSLNDVNRAGLTGMIGFEAAIDVAAKAAKDNAGSLRIVNGQLDLNSKKARDGATALENLAARTDEAAGAARENGSSWSTVNGIYTRGRIRLIESAEAMGLTREEARKLAAQILKTPDKTARLRGNMEDLQAKLDSAKKQLKTVPDSRRAKIQANIDQLQEQIRRAKAELGTIGDKTVTFRGVFASTSADRNANGIPDTIERAHGGLVGGVGSSTSDSNLVRISRGEYVVRAAAVDRYGVGLLDRLNAMQLRDGGLVGQVRTQQAAGFAVAGATVVNNITVNLTNAGVLGSRPEVLDFLSFALDRMARTNRLPVSLTGGV